MENVNSTASLSQFQKQQKEQQQQQQQQQKNEQQFCLRWHNHQTSLLSALPILLDQCHLTDVTISVEGRLLRAHRVVLSACSSYFLELFRGLDAANYPVIIIPGASYNAVFALLTFMYSGEVNVYAEQIPMLISLAETLGVKGLADGGHNNLPKPEPPKCSPTAEACDLETTKAETNEESPTSRNTPEYAAATASTLENHLTPASNAAALTGKYPPTIESLLLRSLPFYPNFLPQPLNFSSNALNKTTELLARYQQQCSLYQTALGGMTVKDFLLPACMPAVGSHEALNSRDNEDVSSAKRLCLGDKRNLQPQQTQQQSQQTQQLQQQQQHLQQQLQQQQQHMRQQLQQRQSPMKDIKRLDKIVESLRCGNKLPSTAETYVAATQQHAYKSNFAASYAPSSSPQQLHVTKNAPLFNTATTNSPQHMAHAAVPQDYMLQQHLENYAQRSRENTPSSAQEAGGSAAAREVKTELVNNNNLFNLNAADKPATPTAATPAVKTTANSKLYATCFICHKQLSNQYNLRVHLETHQNVRYACNVCSHVSRSKDALRKHVSYRHPGAPSPCEAEAKRKRAKTLNSDSSLATPPSPNSAPAAPFQQAQSNNNVCGGGSQVAAYDVSDSSTHAAGFMLQEDEVAQIVGTTETNSGSMNTNLSVTTAEEVATIPSVANSGSTEIKKEMEWQSPASSPSQERLEVNEQAASGD